MVWACTCSATVVYHGGNDEIEKVVTAEFVRLHGAAGACKVEIHPGTEIVPPAPRGTKPK